MHRIIFDLLRKDVLKFFDVCFQVTPDQQNQLSVAGKMTHALLKMISSGTAIGSKTWSA